MRELEELVASAKGLLETRMPELEVRFCLLDMATLRHSTSQLPSSMCERVCSLFAKSTHWHSASQDWELSHVFMFRDRDVEYRTETKFPFGENSHLETETIQKKRVARVDLAVVPAVPVFSTTPLAVTPTVGVRVAVADEVRVADASLPAHVAPTQVFVKHRRTYWYGSTGGPVWMYTLTKRWAGSTLEAAYAALDAQPDPGLEIEIELQSADYLRAKSSAFIAQSLHLKVKDILALIDPALAGDSYKITLV